MSCAEPFALPYRRVFPGIAADGPVPPPPIDYPAVIRDLHNHERHQAGLHLLTPDHRCGVVAQARAEAQRARGLSLGLSHDGDGDGVLDAVEEWWSRYPIDWTYIGENLARIGGQPSEDGSPWYKRMMWLWMNSPSHRSNILHSDFARFGTGHTEAAGIHYVAVVLIAL